MRPLVDGSPPVTPHTGKVKGGQYKAAVDVHAPGATVYAPFDAKVPHIYPDKTRCEGPAPAGSNQFTLKEEVPKGHDGKDRHATGRNVAVARIVAAPGLARHVKEGDVIGTVFGEFLHVASNKPELLGQVT